MPSPFRNLLDVAVVACALAIQWRLLGWALEMRLSQDTRAQPGILRGIFWLAAAVLVVACGYGVLLGRRIVPSIVLLDWMRGFAIAWCLAMGGIFVVALVLRRVPPFSPERRRFMTAASGVALAAPVAAAGAAIVTGREGFSVDEEKIRFAGLPADLDGLRILHLSDIHLGPFLESSALERVVEMSNETRPHIAVVTGDLITARDHWLSECLRVLSGLRPEAGIYGCFGNHEMRARCLVRGKREGASLGIEFLRSETVPVRFGSAILNLAGVDYQQSGKPYLTGAGRLLAPGAFNLLLSHNPDVFPVAVKQGWDLTLAGHTHGGQITAGIFHQYLNVARVLTPYIYGTYREADSAIYVTRGIGTVGVPARIGAPPEIGLIELCAT